MPKEQTYSLRLDSKALKALNRLQANALKIEKLVKENRKLVKTLSKFLK